ncbi:uncharacterized protein [Mytilus edulis]|uniref:uncharacterized protein n=1 Tax=Mytilus edulis TaxID=6550 RepID=UPI0039F05F79
MPKQNKKSPSQKNREDKLRKRLARHKLGTEESKDIPRPASQQLFTVANPNSQSQQPTTSKIDSQKFSTVSIQFKPGLTVKKRKSQDTNLFATTSTTDIPTEPARTKELNWFCEYLNDQDMRNIHKKSLYSPKHSKNLNASLPGLTQQKLNNLSTRKKSKCPQNRRTENEKRNLTRKERRNIPEVKDQENARRNETRSHRRSMNEVKEQESVRRNITRQKRRCIPEVKEQESARSNITRQKQRSIPEVKEQESARSNITRKKRRSIPEVKEQESARSNITRQKRRCIPEVRDHGNAKRQKTRQDRRSIPEVKEQESARRNITRQKRRSIPKVRDKEKTSRQKWRHTYNRNKKRNTSQQTFKDKKEK